jgi:hypothetical protein
MQNYRKAKNILNRYGLANMVEETQFEQLDRFFTGLPGLEGESSFLERAAYKTRRAFTAENIINKGYWMLEKAEKSIQIPIFIGMMTQEEWDSYDVNGHVINKANKLSEARASELTRRVGYIHGFYSKQQASPFILTPHGAAIFQFRKFAPSLFMKLFGGYRYDRNYILRSGIVQSLGTIARVVKFGGFTGKEAKMERIQQAFIDMNKRKADEKRSPFAYAGMSEHLDNILIKLDTDPSFVNALKNIPKADMKNLRSAILQSAVMLVLYWAAFGGDPDDPREGFLRNYIRKQTLRYLRDVVYFISIQNIKEMTESPAAGLSILVNGVKLMGLSLATAYYEATGKVDPYTHYSQNSFYYRAGDPKLFYSIGDVIPFGAFYKFAYRNAYRMAMYSMLAKDPKGAPILDPVTKEPMTWGKVMEKARQWEKYEEQAIRSRIHGKLIDSNETDPETYYSKEEYMRRMDRTIDMIQHASEMIKFEIALKNGEKWAVDIERDRRAHEEESREMKKRTTPKSTKQLKNFIRINETERQ